MLRVYRWLLRLYPAGFRDEYAAPMEQALRDELAEAPNIFAAALVGLRLLFDFSLSFPAQVAREMWRDSKHALRLWAKHPWQTGFAVLALATAIGVNTGVFSVVNALLLRSLPFRDPDRLAFLRTSMLPHDSAARFDEWRKTSKYLEDAALSQQKDVNLGEPEHMLRVLAARISWNFFSFLGVPPQLGRGFNAGDADSIVISYGVWQGLFAGSERVLAQTVSLDGDRLRILGVMPPGFDYPNKSAIWKVANLGTGNNGWDLIGRIKPGMKWAQAKAAFLAEVAARAGNRKRPPMAGGLVPLTRCPCWSSKDGLPTASFGRSIDPLGCLRESHKFDACAQYRPARRIGHQVSARC
jgi:hypothetical protein